MQQENWQENLIESAPQLRRLLQNVRRIAVLGIKPEDHRHQPAFYVPEYLHTVGYEIVPVPVYYPDVTTILGKRVYRSLREIPEQVDLVNIFRRSFDIPPHLDDILAARPRAVWMQSGIRNDEVAEALARAGIEVVQDRCLMVEHRRLVGG